MPLVLSDSELAAVMEAARPSAGRVLHYQQFVHAKGFESVSFASMAFDH